MTPPMTGHPIVRLVPATVALLDAAITGDGHLADALGHAVAPGWATFTEALPVVRDQVAADPDGVTWGPRLFVTGDPPLLVGWGGFKGAPRDGAVEIGYEIAESLRNRGLATAAAVAMIDAARADPRVRAITAHTLAEPNASNHVLTKLGFRFDGELHDDGERVWRFVLDPAVPAT